MEKEKLTISLACLRDSHRQLFFQKLGTFEPWYVELSSLFRYCYRSWSMFFRDLEAEEPAAFSETGVESFDRDDFMRRAEALRSFFERRLK